MRFTGTSGITYETADAPLGRGGEGSIYAVESVRRAGSSTPSRPGPNDVRLVVKELAAGRADATRQAKLAAMVARQPPASARGQLAWPLDILVKQGRFVGYVMPQVRSARNLNEYYVAGPDGIGGPAGRGAGYARQLTLAHNLCVAVAAVHDLGQVIGDLNPANGLVDTASWNVTLIDCDSFHITDAAGHTYRCSVGMADYLAPEVHAALARAGAGASLETIDPSPYSRATDLFSLAVLVFALLMNGCHPFACAVDPWRGANIRCPQPLDNIRTGFSPFFERRRGLTTPIYAPSAACLTPELRALFKRAFVRGHAHPDARPDARAWAGALRTVLDSLESCPSCGAEHFAGRPCPRCDVRAGMTAATGTLQARGRGATRAGASGKAGTSKKGSGSSIPSPHVPFFAPGGTAKPGATKPAAAKPSVASAALAPATRGCVGVGLVGAICVAAIAQWVLAIPLGQLVSVLSWGAGDWRIWVVLASCIVLLLARIPAPRGDGRDAGRFLRGAAFALAGTALVTAALLGIDLLATSSVPGHVALAAEASALGVVRATVDLAAVLGLPLASLFALVYGIVGTILLRRRASKPA